MRFDIHVSIYWLSYTCCFMYIKIYHYQLSHIYIFIDINTSCLTILFVGRISSKLWLFTYAYAHLWLCTNTLHKGGTASCSEAAHSSENSHWKNSHMAGCKDSKTHHFFSIGRSLWYGLTAAGCSSSCTVKMLSYKTNWEIQFFKKCIQTNLCMHACMYVYIYPCIHVYRYI
jgi:hypothetical protein